MLPLLRWLLPVGHYGGRPSTLYGIRINRQPVPCAVFNLFQFLNGHNVIMTFTQLSWRVRSQRNTLRSTLNLRQLLIRVENQAFSGFISQTVHSLAPSCSQARNARLNLVEHSLFSSSAILPDQIQHSIQAVSFIRVQVVNQHFVR